MADGSPECLRSLVFPNIHARRNDIDPAHRNTCDWLFQSPEFRKWKDPAFLPDHNGILWIKGKPGAGKSTLMKHAYRRCQKVIFRDHLIVDFFFNAQGKMLEEHTPLGMLQSIVYKLIRGDDALYEVFIPSYHEKRRASLDGKFLWHQSELKEIIRSMVTRSESQPLLFLIDALDECEELEIRNIIEFLESLSIYASGNNIPLKICISSRHFPNIGIGKFVELRVEKSQEHQADIAQYVNDRLRAKLYTYDIAAEIVKSADNVFLWVAVVVSLLNNAYDEGKGIEATRKILKETPSSLESIFSVILSRNKSELSETVLLLQWVLLSGQPLEPYQLFAAVVGEAPPFKDVAALRIATSSRGLVEIRKGARETVHFIHHSVREFLSRPRTLQELDSTLGPSPVRTTHGRLWARCLFEIEQARSAWAIEKHLAVLNKVKYDTLT